MKLATDPRRRVLARISIPAGNLLQMAGILAACLALVLVRSTLSPAIAVCSLAGAWILLYLSCHALAHWLVGRILGIRFLYYTVGGTANPGGWPRGVRWIFEHLPFLGVQTEKLSMQKASPGARALMWSAGVTSSATLPALGALAGLRSDVSFTRWFLLFALLWSFGTFTSNWRSTTGDYAKARRALRGG